jgi:hypothetical protein
MYTGIYYNPFLLALFKLLFYRFCHLFPGYIWWSLIHAVGAMIWFYPLNELEITGYEAFAVVLLSPVVVNVSFVSRFISSHVGLAMMRLFSMVGVISFQASTTFSRLLLLMFGCGCAMLWLCGAWWSKSPRER